MRRRRFFGGQASDGGPTGRTTAGLPGAGPRSGPSDDLTPQHGTPRVPRDGTPGRGTARLAGPVTPPQGTPQARGGHPEHHEPGGGWGTAPGAPPRSGGRPGGPFGGPGTISSPTYGMRSRPGPREGTPGGPQAGPGSRWTDTGAHPLPGPRITGPQVPGSRIPGPRQEYIDAFDDDDAYGHGMDDDVDVFTPRRTPRAGTTVGTGSSRLFPGADGPDGTGGPDAYGAPGAPGGETRAGSARLASAGVSGRGPGGRGFDDDVTDDPSTDGDEGRDDTARRTTGGKGRTFTGIAAAAVTTVLAVVVAGQVTHGRSDDAPPLGEGPSRSATSPDSDGRPEGPARHAPAQAPLTYAQKMAKIYPLDPHLKASGKFTTVPGHDKAPGHGRVYRYRVDVEKGLGLDGELFAQAVQKTLNDDRSWAHGGGRTFERVSSGQPDFVITLASPGTTAAWCAKSGLDTSEENVSCDSAATDRVVINAYRWAKGAKTYGDERIHAYRQMLINHEVGHRLGYNHVVCTQNGALAPIMQQQTKFLTYNGITCKPNAWPYPEK